MWRNLQTHTFPQRPFHVVYLSSVFSPILSFHHLFPSLWRSFSRHYSLYLSLSPMGQPASGSLRDGGIEGGGVLVGSNLWDTYAGRDTDGWMEGWREALRRRVTVVWPGLAICRSRFGAQPPPSLLTAAFSPPVLHLCTVPQSPPLSA